MTGGQQPEMPRLLAALATIRDAAITSMCELGVDAAQSDPTVGSAGHESAADHGLAAALPVGLEMPRLCCELGWTGSR